MSKLPQITSDFIAESIKLTRAIEGGILQMESAEMQDEAARAVFKAIHSIKTGAGITGMAKIKSLARMMESLLDCIRHGDLEPAEPVTDSLLQALDVLASLFDYAHEQESIEIDSSLKAMEAALQTELPPELLDDLNELAIGNPAGDPPDLKAGKYALNHALEQGNLYYLRLGLEKISQRELTPIQLVNELMSMGEVLDSTIIRQTGGNGPEPPPPDAFGFLYATVLDQDQLRAALHLDQHELSRLDMEDLISGQGQPPENNTQGEVRPPAITGSGESTDEHAGAEPAPPPAQTEPRRAAAQKQSAFHSLAEPQEAEDDSPGHEYITFTLGRENYGLDILAVQEIIALPRLTRLPRSPLHVLGVMNLRGMVVPVVDMRLRLNLPTDDDIEPVVMVVKVGSKHMGAVVDAVSDVVEFKDSEIQEPPDFAVAVHKEYLSGLCRQNDDLVVILNLDQILAPEAQSGE